MLTAEIQDCVVGIGICANFKRYYNCILPNDDRILLKTRRQFGLKDVLNGNYYHCGQGALEQGALSYCWILRCQSMIGAILTNLNVS